MRLKSAAAVTLMQRAFQRMVQRWTHGQRPRVHHPLAKWFPDVVLIDSTLMHVDDSLKKVFKGLRTAVASMKATLTLSAFGGVPLDVRLSSGTAHDTNLFPALNLFRPRSLLLFDRGFVAFDKLREIQDHGLYFICTLKQNTNAVIRATNIGRPDVDRDLRAGKRLMLRSIIAKGAKVRRIWDFQVALRTRDCYTCANPITARLIIMPGRGGEQRGYLTNLPPAWTPQSLRELYRLRWQIELAFKELKQHLNLTSLPTRDRHAVQVFAWASFMALALSRTIAEVLMPTRDIGLQAAQRPALFTRHLAEAKRFLVVILTSPEILALLSTALLCTARVDPFERKRPDSWARLKGLTPPCELKAA
jgi:hypothetical protein